jgi:hypothetical protein
LINKLTAYAKRGNRKVQGWLTPIAIDVICELSDLQQRMGIRGPVCEIGIHHGRLFILLHLLTAKDEKSVAYDLFERQDENVDRSGHGDKQVFQKNLKRYHCDLGRITINTENSLNLTPDKILSDCSSKIRLFSIDGGHTPEITYNDLSLAAKTLCDGGLIILDDFFNESWPGVAEGTCKYLINKDTSLFPVVIAGNKFIFTNNKKIASYYINGINKQHRGYGFKKLVVFGNEALIFPFLARRNPRAFLATTYIWQSIRNKPIGRFIKRTLRIQVT